MNKIFPVGDWFPSKTTAPVGAGSTRSDSNNSNRPPEEGGEGAGGDVEGDAAFMMLINGTQATEIDPEGKPIPSPVFSFRVLGGTVTFRGDEFENNLTETAAGTGPENVEFPTGGTEYYIAYCKVTFTRNPDATVADQKITAIDSAEIEFSETSAVTDGLNMWSGTFANPQFLFKIGYLAVTQVNATSRYVFTQVLQVGNFIYDSEVLPLELQVIVEESGTNVVKTLKLKGNISSAS